MNQPQQAARDRAVTSLKELVRTYVPDMGEESRDQVRLEVEAAIDELIAALTAGPSEPGWRCVCGEINDDSRRVCRMCRSPRTETEVHRQVERTDGSER